MSNPLDDCMLFMPRAGGPEGTYSVLNRPYGWADCNAKQNAFLHANTDAHVPATRLLGQDSEEDYPRGALNAFKVFVVGGMVRDGVRLCSHCHLPGHNRRTCTLPSPELVDL